MLKNSMVDKLHNSTVAFIAVSVYLAMNENPEIIDATLPIHAYNPDTNRWKLQGRQNAMNSFGRRPNPFSQKTLAQYRPSVTTAKRL